MKLIETARKRFLVVILICAMMIGSLPTNIYAVTAPEGVKQQNLSNGDFTINQTDTYYIYQTSSPTANTITINCDVTIYLAGVNIRVPKPVTAGDETKRNPININGNYTVNIYLVDGTTNSLASEAGSILERGFKLGSSKAGIRVPSGATLNIYGDTGVLNASGAEGYNVNNSTRPYQGGGGAGIGTDGGFRKLDNTIVNPTNSGIVNIYGGIINATGGNAAGEWGSGGSGIGAGGFNYDMQPYDLQSGKVTIEGGVVTAIGGGGAYPNLAEDENRDSGKAIGGELTIKVGGILIAKSGSSGQEILVPLEVQPVLPTSYQWRTNDTAAFTLSSTSAFSIAWGQRYVEINAEALLSISDIVTPAAITTGGKLSLVNPTVTGVTTEQKWQYSSDQSTWIDFVPATKTFSISENGYYIRYFAANANGTATSNTVLITVNKYNPTLIITAEPTTATYPEDILLTATLSGTDRLDGKAVSFFWGDFLLGVRTTDVNGVVIYNKTNSFPMDHEFRAVFSGDQQNNAVSNSVIVRVNKGTQSVVTFADNSDINKTYGDASFSLPAVTGGDGTGIYRYYSSNNNVVTVSDGTVTINGAGEAIVYAYKFGDVNYNSSAEDSIKVIVAPKNVTIDGIDANDKIYDGNLATAINSADGIINGIINDDVVSIDYTSASASFTDKNVGNNKEVSFTGFKLTGADAANYLICSQPTSVIANITPKSITISGISAIDKNYDGNTEATLSYNNVIFNGKVTEDSLGITGIGTFVSSDVSTIAKTINISNITLNGTSANNYVLASTGQQTTTTAKITPATITITPISNQSKYYGQSDPELNYLYSGVIEGEQATFLGELARTVGNEISSYTFNIGSLTIVDNDQFKTMNYQLSLDTSVLFEVKEYVSSALATATPNGDNGWFKLPPIILTAPEGYTISTSNDLSDNTWTSQITLNDADMANKTSSYYLKAISGSAINAITSRKIYDYSVDKTAPTDVQATYGTSTSFELLNVGSFSLFFNEQVTVTLQASDATSGVDHFDVSFTSNPTKSDLRVNKVNDKFTFMIDPQFVGNFTVKATDKAGNQSTAVSFENVAVDDNVPSIPSITAVSNGLPYTSGIWTTEDVELIVAGSEADSGIAKYQYSINNGLTWSDMITTEATTATNMTSYNATKAEIELSSSQNNTYRIRAVSNSGLFSNAQSFIVRLDKDLPVITTADIQYSVINTNTLAQIGHFLSFGNFFKEGLRITVPATDATSGLNELYYTIKKADDTVIKAASVSFTAGSADFTIAFDEVKDNNDITIELYINDIAGNTTAIEKLEGTSNSDNWTFESVNPVIGNLQTLGNDITVNQWFNTSSVNITSDITDGSGIYKVSYKVDDSESYTDISAGLGMAGVKTLIYDFAKTITGDGNHTLTLLVADNAMNTTIKNISFNIDTSLPTIVSVTGNPITWQNIDVTLTVNASDIGSGLDDTPYSFDGGLSWQADNTKTYSVNQTIAANTIKVKDLAGNIQSYSDAIYITKIDKTNPDDPTIEVSADIPSNDWYTIYPTIEIITPIFVSGSASETTYYKLWNTSASIDNTEPISSTVLVTQPVIANDGVWKLKTWTVDEANNSSTPLIITIKVDNTAPNGDIEIEENSVKTFLNAITFGLFFNENIEVNISAQDITSGVEKIEYYKSSNILDPEVVRSLTSEWIEFDGMFTETAEDASNVIYYVKITDRANNVVYFGSNGVTFDTTTPLISGIINNGTYYVDQYVNVSDTNLESITLDGNPFMSGDNLLGNIEASYTVIASDKAGNSSSVSVTMMPIANLSTRIDLLAIENVTSSYKDTITDVLVTIEAALLTTDNGATQQQIDQLNVLLTKCHDLLNKIKEITNKITDINIKTNGITLNNVKSSDKTNLEMVVNIINDLLATNNLTTSERSSLEQKKNDIQNYLTRIVDIQKAIINSYNPVRKITIDNVLRSDKLALEKALGDLQRIMSYYTNNLTKTETLDVQGKIDLIKDILRSLTDVEDLEDLINALPPTKDVTKDDIDQVNKVQETYDKLSDHQKGMLDASLTNKLDEVIQALKMALLYDEPTKTRIEGINGTSFDLKTRLVVTPLIDVLDKEILRLFTIGLKTVAKGQQFVQLNDIKLILDGKAIQPNGLVKITLTLTDEQANHKDLQVVYVSDDGTITIITSTINGNEISFTTDHFSYYGIIGTPTSVFGFNTVIIPLVSLAAISIFFLVFKKKRKVDEHN